MEIHQTAIIHPGAKIAEGVTVGPYSVIEQDVSIGKGTTIGAHVVIRPYVTIGEQNDIRQFASIGEVPQDLKFAGEKTRLVIGDRNRIREFVTLNRGTQGGGGVTSIGSDCLLMTYSHVAHDCHIGDHVILANGVQMGGHVHIGDHAIVGGLTALHQHIRIGAHAMVGGASAAVMDVPPYTNAAGNRAELHGLNLIGLKRRGFAEQTLAALKKAYRILFRSGLTLEEAKARVAAEVDKTPEVEYLLKFIEESERGIAR